MPEPPTSEGKPVVGRTWADALVDIAKLLGSLAPIAIIVGGALVGLYMFRDQAQRSQRELREAREQVMKQNEQERQTASKALQDSYGELRQTYETMGKLSGQQIENLKKQLEFHGQVATSTEAERNRLQKVQEESAHQAKLTEDNRMAAEKAKAEARQARATKEELERTASEMGRRAQEAQRQYEQLQERLKREQERVAGRAGEIGRLREQLDQLATAASKESANEFRSRAEKILEDLREPGQVLQMYAANPKSNTSANMKQLVGLSASSVESHLRRDLGYAIWLKGLDKTGKLEGFLGAVSQDESKDEGVVVLMVGKGNITDVEVSDQLFVVAMTDADNWQQKKSYMYRIAGEEIDVQISDPKRADRWTYQRLLDEQDDLRTEVLFGTERRHQFVTPEEFQRLYRSAYEQVKKNKQRDGLALRMEERAKGFDAARAIGNVSTVQPPPLRDALIALVNATVRRDAARSRELLERDPTGDLAGRLASLALREGFAVISSPVEDYRSASSTTQQAPTIEHSTAERTARMIVEYQEQFSSTARSVLRWREITGGRWVLTEVGPVPDTTR